MYFKYLAIMSNYVDDERKIHWGVQPDRVMPYQEMDDDEVVYECEDGEGDGYEEFEDEEVVGHPDERTYFT